jgi:quercetin dioxygenase-like cupin family protein
MTLNSTRMCFAAMLVFGGLTLAAASASVRGDFAESGVAREDGQQLGSDPNFTGVVTPMDAKDVTAGRRKFEAGARTAWHSHDKGQLIYAESGRMRTGRRGQAFTEYAAGGSEYTPPNVEHWHGATPAEPLVQVNIQFGGTTKWLTKTTDE